MAKEWIVPDADLGCDGAYFDYQELVRCRECLHYNAGFECLVEGYGIERDPDWYCEDGEREVQE